MKPDVTAPGSPITSALISGPAAYGAYVNGITGAVGPSATSWATPQASGAAALVRDYFTQGFHPTGAAVSGNAMAPTAALVKAVLVNGARESTGAGSDANGEGRWPNSSQGRSPFSPQAEHPW